MEFPTVNDSATSAKYVPPEAFLANLLLHNHVNIVRGDELVAPAPVSAAPQPVPVPRRQRKHSLPRIIAAARKAGADHVMVDGVKIALSPTAAVPEPTANEWDTVLLEDDHGPH
jgi:hypothetical protein